MQRWHTWERHSHLGRKDQWNRNCWQKSRPNLKTSGRITELLLPPSTSTAASMLLTNFLPLTDEVKRTEAGPEGSHLVLRCHTFSPIPAEWQVKSRGLCFLSGMGWHVGEGPERGRWGDYVFSERGERELVAPGFCPRRDGLCIQAGKRLVKTEECVGWERFFVLS